jgi:hypothetical protein
LILIQAYYLHQVTWLLFEGYPVLIFALDNITTSDMNRKNYRIIRSLQKMEMNRLNECMFEKQKGIDTSQTLEPKGL